MMCVDPGILFDPEILLFGICLAEHSHMKGIMYFFEDVYDRILLSSHKRKRRQSAVPICGLSHSVKQNKPSHGMIHREGHTITSVFFLPKVHKLNVSMKKRQVSPNQKTLYKYLTRATQSVSMIKDKGR